MMKRIPVSRLRRIDYTPLLLILLMVLMWGLLCHLTGKSFVGSSPYNTYTRQAMAWREGHTWIENVDYLELAIFNGHYYVSFPPVPSVVLWPLTFIFGQGTPDNLLVKLYACIACIMMYYAFRHAGYRKLNAGLGAFFMTFASSMPSLTLEGAVWYHAQVLAFLCITSAICLLSMDKPTPALVMYALAVGCRPFSALYGIPLILIYCSIAQKNGLTLKYMWKRLRLGILLGLCVAAAYAGYNYMRFQNPLEFGHNYLPEFSFQGSTQFSLSHVWDNVQIFLFGLPISVTDSGVELERFGFSMFIACPMLSLMLVWAVQDLVHRTMTREKVLILVCFLLQLFLLLLHHTFGGFQLGARYCVDLVPYAFFYQLMRKEKKEFPVWELTVLCAVFLFMFYGTTVICL